MMTARSTELSGSNSLSYQLSQFGLNPQDWQTAILRPHLYLIVHREDPDMKMVGQTQNSSGIHTWKEIFWLETSDEAAC